MTQLTCTACEYGYQHPFDKGLIGHIVAQIHLMATKRQRRKIMISLPDHLLSDVGLTQDDIAQERAKSWLL